jgi:hypothetical protein
VNIVRDPPDEDEGEEFSYVDKICKIFKVFSMGDAEVKAKMCTNEILTSNLQSL